MWFDYETQRRSDVEKKWHFHSEIRTSSNGKNWKEKQEMVDPSDESAPQVSSNKVVQSDQQPTRLFDEKNEISDDKVNPCDRISDDTVNPSDQQSTRHSVAQKHKLTEDIVCSSGIEDPQVSFTSMESSNNAVKLDHQRRRQSTRNRPLTTKALEALEIELSSVRPYRKRSTSVAQGHIPKRVFKSGNKVLMFSHETVLEATASKETSNRETNMVE